jgi:sulfur carrier protein ThiS
MPECEYCDASFDDEATYDTHLGAEHADELGPIDRRRLSADTADADTDRPIGLIVLGVFLVVIIGVGVVTFLSSGNGSSPEFQAEQQPSNLGSVHTHGTIEVAIDGQRIDFSQDQYQVQADAFHFENGGGTRWHVHAQGVTLEYAMATLGIDVTESTVTHQGTTYRDSASNTSVTVTVNGEPVTPSEYVLRDGDRIRIIVERS